MNDLHHSRVADGLDLEQLHGAAEVVEASVAARCEEGGKQRISIHQQRVLIMIVLQMQAGN